MEIALNMKITRKKYEDDPKKEDDLKGRQPKK